MNTPDPAMAESVRWLLEQQTLVRAPKREPLPTPITGGGSAPTVVVAASDSTQYSKGRADFVCTGLNDEMIIQRALNICSLTGGIVWLCEGEYSLEIPAGDAAIVVPPTVILSGVGSGYDGGVMLEMQNASDPGRLALVRLRGHSEIRNITMYPWDSALGVKLTDFEGFMRITDCWIETRNGACIEGEESNDVWIERNLLFLWDDPTTEDDSCIHIYGAAGILDLRIERNWIIGGWHGVFLDGQQGRNHITDNLITQAWFSGVRLKSDNAPIFATHVTNNDILTPGAGSDGSTGEACIYISADGSDVDPLTVQDNLLIIADNALEVASTCHGIRLTDCCLVTVHDNPIEQQGLHGIFLDNAHYCQIHDHTIQEPNTFPTTTYDGIYIDGDGNYVRLNTIIEHGGGSPNYFQYAINVAAGTANIVIANDLRLAGSGTGFINDAGTGTLLAWPAGGAGIGDNWV